MEQDDLEYIEAEKLTLDEWLQLLESPPKKVRFINYAFPTDAHREEYLKSIARRNDDEVIRLLRFFLIPSGAMGLDKYQIEWYLKSKEVAPDIHEKLSENEYTRRLLLWVASDGKTPSPWEGITWVLDLLPHWPREAIAALDAYFLAHCQFLPDVRIEGLSDVTEIIRAKFIGLPGNQQESIDLLMNLNPRHFECLVERLYYKMNYKTQLTSPTKDGGRDIIASKKEAGRSEELRIECKRRSRPIGVREARTLLGVVSDEKANKGIIVCSNTFTRDARKFELANRRIELIDGQSLVLLLNEYLGPTWPLQIERLVMESLKSTQSRNAKK